MEEMTNNILAARELRGAGDKPVLRKYDPNALIFYEADNILETNQVPMKDSEVR
jgi:hypothetical protein